MEQEAVRTLSDIEIISIRNVLESQVLKPRRCMLVYHVDPENIRTIVLDDFKARYGRVELLDDKIDAMKRRGHTSPTVEFFFLNQLSWMGTNFLFTYTINSDIIREAKRLGLCTVYLSTTNKYLESGNLSLPFEFDVIVRSKDALEEETFSDVLRDFDVIYTNIDWSLYDHILETSNSIDTGEDIIYRLESLNAYQAKIDMLITRHQIKAVWKVIESKALLDSFLLFLEKSYKISLSDIFKDHLYIDPECRCSNEEDFSEGPWILMNPRDGTMVPSNTIKFSIDSSVICILLEEASKISVSVEDLPYKMKQMVLLHFMKSRLHTLSGIDHWVKADKRVLVTSLRGDASLLHKVINKKVSTVELGLHLQTHIIKYLRGRYKVHKPIILDKYWKYLRDGRAYYGTPSSVLCLPSLISYPDGYRGRLSNDMSRMAMIYKNGLDDKVNIMQDQWTGISSYGTLTGTIFRLAGLSSKKYYDYRRKVIPPGATQSEDRRIMSILSGKTLSPSGHLFSILFLSTIIPINVMSYLLENNSRMRGYKPMKKDLKYELWPDIDNSGVFHTKQEMILGIKALKLFLKEMRISDTLITQYESYVEWNMKNYTGKTVLDAFLN